MNFAPKFCRSLVSRCIIAACLSFLPVLLCTSQFHARNFRDTIREYLEQRAGADALFAASCAKEHKNLDDCITFILNYVQQSGCNGFTDAEIYSLAVHYYDEDDIDVGKPLDCRVVVNHTIVLTEEEQREAHEQALRKATEEAYAKITHKSKSQPASNAANAANQQSLF